MIVVDNAIRDIGKKVRVNVTRTHQTVAGKMIFAQKVSEGQGSPRQSATDSDANHSSYRLPRPRDKKTFNYHDHKKQNQS
jgi:hypothetical protein